MKLIAIQRFFKYGDNVGEENYLIRLEEFKSLQIDRDPKTPEICFKTKDYTFQGIVFEDLWANFCDFLENDDDTLAFAIYDDYSLIPDEE